MHKLFLLLLIAGLGLTAAQKQPSSEADHTRHDESRLLEIGHATKLSPEVPSTDQIKVVSYNIRWRGGKSLQKLAEALKTDPEVGGATVLGLQEVDRNKSRTDNFNTAKFLADELGMHYAWAAPPTPKGDKEEETGVLLLSRHPLTDLVRIVLPHDGPNKRRRVGLGATVHLGGSKLRAYSVHAETRVGMDKKIDQLRAVTADLAHYPKDMPAIVMGDFNTWQADAEEKTKKFFTNEGFATPFAGQPTFCRRVVFVEITFRLDWIWLRHLEPTASGIDTKITYSDHWPLWVALKTKSVRP